MADRIGCIGEGSTCSLLPPWVGWTPSQGWTWSDVAAQVTACLLTLHVATGQLALSAFHLILLLPTVAQADIDVDNLLDDQAFSKAS